MKVGSMQYNFSFLLAVFIITVSFDNYEGKLPEQNHLSSQLIAEVKAVDSDSVALIKEENLKFYKKDAHASYYADKFNGRKTASGKKFDNSKYTAAHKKLPFGTRLKITNQSNNKSVIVEVNDRGPFTAGREIDLSKQAFFDIAKNKSHGALKVTIEIIE